jgi:tetratricopeptide (TPR) repeat protein
MKARMVNAALGLIVLAVIGVLFFGAYSVLNANRAVMQSAQHTTNPGPTDPQTEEDRDFALARLDMQRRDSAKSLEHAKSLDTAGGVGDLVQQAEKLIYSAEQFYKLKNYVDAKVKLDEAQGLLAKVDEQEKARGEARLARNATDSIKTVAGAAGVQKDVPRLWEKALDDYRKAALAYDQGDFKAALAGFNSAKDQLEKGQKINTDYEKVRVARKAFEDDAFKIYTREKLNALGGQAWKLVLDVTDAADKDMNEGNIDKAVEKYKQAKDMLPAVLEAVKLEAGLNYWAFDAGRTTYRILIELSSGKTLTDKRLGELQTAYERLRLPASFFARVPQGADADAAQVGQVLLLEAPDVIEKNRGKAARASFAVGIQWIAIERLLKVDVLTISEATKGDITQSLKTMTEEVKNAGYAPVMDEFLRAFRLALDKVPDNKAVSQCRLLWRDMTEKLDNYETAIKIVTKE